MLTSAVMVTMEIGAHALVQDGEVVSLTLRGPLLDAHVEQLRARVLEILHVGRCFIVADMRGLTTIDPAARRAFGDWGRTGDLHITGAAVFGSSFAMRVMSTLLLNAVRMLGRRELQVVFVRDEAEARAWVAERMLAS